MEGTREGPWLCEWGALKVLSVAVGRAEAAQAPAWVGAEGCLPEVGGNPPEHCLRRTRGRMRQRTRRKEKRKEKLPLEATQFLRCSRARDLPRKECALHYRGSAPFPHGQRRLY